MGTGKSKVGKKLAARLDRKFIDTDVLVAREEGMSIAQICLEDGVVIATGGGTMVNEENVAKLKASGTVICLSATPEVIFARVGKDDTRPLLQDDEPLARIRALLSVRAPAYAKADVTIDTSYLSVNEVVQAVLAILGKDQERM